MAGHYGGYIGNTGGLMAADKASYGGAPNRPLTPEEIERLRGPERTSPPSNFREQYLPKPTIPLAGSPFGSSNLAGATAQMNPGQPGNFAGFTDQLQAQNQGPSTPVKYYPDAFGGQGGILPNRGAAGPANVRPKGSTPLAQDFIEGSDGMEQMLAQLRENQSSLPNGFINKYVS